MTNPDPLDTCLEKLLAGEHLEQHIETFASAADGSELRSHAVEVWGETVEGNRVSVVQYGQVIQPNGMSAHPTRVRDFCPSCHCFSEWLLPTCKKCGGGICKQCESQRGGELWHRDCLKKSRRLGLFWGLLGLPLRFFVEKEIEE